MTDEKKQIEEMANDLAKICPDLVENCCGQVNCVTHLTLSLSKIGYRKERIGRWVEKNPNIKTARIKDNMSNEIYVTADHCSECGYKSRDVGNYCSNCGSKMKGE